MAQAIVNAGKAWITAVVNPSTRGAQSTQTYGAWGGTATAPALADAALGSELPEARVACTMTRQTTSTTNDTWRNVWTVTATANRTVNEAGVYDDQTVGSDTLIYRGTHATLNIETSDQVTYTFNDRHADSNLDGV